MRRSPGLMNVTLSAVDSLLVRAKRTVPKRLADLC